MSNDGTWNQATHTLTLIGQQNPTSEHLKALHDGAITDLVQAIMNGTLPARDEVRKFYGMDSLHAETVGALPAPLASLTAHTGILTVDYGQTLEQMVAAGHYGKDGKNWNKDITAERFPIVGTGVAEFECKLFDFGRDISSEDAVKAIQVDDPTNPWKPARTEHTLAYGAQFPDEQRKNPIIGLGSGTRVRGFRSVLALLADGGRYLGLYYSDDGWNALYRFLAVRPVPKTSVA